MILMGRKSWIERFRVLFWDSFHSWFFTHLDGFLCILSRLSFLSLLVFSSLTLFLTIVYFIFTDSNNDLLRERDLLQRQVLQHHITTAKWFLPIGLHLYVCFFCSSFPLKLRWFDCLILDQHVGNIFILRGILSISNKTTVTSEQLFTAINSIILDIVEHVCLEIWSRTSTR